ncbi:type II toxin-antitoxin system RelE family toxin [Leptolyngbya sp. PCC 6406]|uniref:type II toxin-antitoxin system RelE family toxin n=1 Tax=Leptolyngbya sp. PCC 6406 TaxID=1173264 RepID=UPI0002AC7150|nr:type II toxin-antitoxin system RelE/ParE family toxin [Leptolyngbya sp. PCC 6406]
MKIKLSKPADKFLKKLDGSGKKTVINKIGILKTCLESQKIYPPEELDIKKLKGELAGFSRIRVGKIRIIFQIRREIDEIFIYDINYRGNIYDR